MEGVWTGLSWRQNAIRLPLRDALLAASLAVSLTGMVILLTLHDHGAFGAEIGTRPGSMEGTGVLPGEESRIVQYNLDCARGRAGVCAEVRRSEKAIPLTWNGRKRP